MVQNRAVSRRVGLGTAAVAFGLALTGCGTPESSTAGSTAPAETSAGEGGGAADAASITFIQGVAGDNFYISMECAATEAAEAAGATLDVQGPQKFDATLQTPILQSVVAAAPDAILIAPNDVTAMQRPIDDAIAAGIEVVLVDTTIEDPSGAVSQIASDNRGGGAAAFEAIKGLAPEGGKVLVIDVQPGVSTTDARVAGFEEAVGADPAYEYLGVQYSKNEPAVAAQLVTAALQADPDIVGIFATNLFSAEGTATGVRQAGREGDVKIVGFDAGPAQVEALQAGTVQALIAQQPGEIGARGVEQALAALAGEETEPEIQTGFTILTADNIAEPASQAAIYAAEC